MQIRAVMHRRSSKSKTGWKKIHGPHSGGGPKAFHFPRDPEAARRATLAQAVAHLARFLDDHPALARNVDRVKIERKQAK